MITKHSGQWYAWGYLPRKSGKVVALHAPKIKSEYNLKWYISVGEHTKASEHISTKDELAGVIILHHADHAQVRRDLFSLDSGVVVEPES